MGGLSIWHWLIVAAVALLLFGGRGKLSQLMGDAAKGIKAFQKGLKEGEDEQRNPSTATEPAGTLPRTEAEQEALRNASEQAASAATTPATSPAEPRT